MKKMYQEPMTRVAVMNLDELMQIVDQSGIDVNDGKEVEGGEAKQAKWDDADL